MPQKFAGPQRHWVLALIRSRDATLQRLTDELAIRGLKVDYWTMWNFVYDSTLRPRRSHTSLPVALKNEKDSAKLPSVSNHRSFFTIWLKLK
jgi:transposase